MKKTILKIIPMILLIMGCDGGAKPVESPANPADNSGVITLDQALKEAAGRIDGRITAGSKIAPLNFNSPHDKFSGYVLDELTANLVDSRILTVVDRKEVDLIRGEFDFQFSGEVGDDSMQELGRMLGAQAIISGSLTDMGGFYRIVIRVLNVQNASVEVQYRANIVNDNIMVALLTGGKSSGMAGTPQRPSTVQTQADQVPATSANTSSLQPVAQAPTESSAHVYEIGNTGPAGGIIFYDKGNDSGGWRYLEAAPVSTEFKAPWGADRANINTDTDIGSGKRNTEIIVRFLWDNGQNGAALLCDELSINGFNDWFLPSKGELNLMYMRLKLKALGNFRQNWYWSSSKDSGRLVWVQTFNDGKQWDSGYYYADDIFVRAIRQF